ncbi:hypothetical protein MSAN_00882100 [Mycena sanguinolenta]|uniref:Uncharacterized protein n=1 Tax=Mycena sanguinolenta TaxID=230812 RepID=A0A8H6YX03_9AGAR|nr:hypothetical protein MSAN_00882100 [Mycena sanguinolenta]
MPKKTKAPEDETLEQLEARLADMKKAAAAPPEKRPRGRPKGSKNKPKTDTEGNAGVDVTSTDAKAKPPKPSKGPKTVKEPKAVKIKPEAKPRGRQASKAKGIPEVSWKHEHELTDSLLTAIELNGPRRQAFGFTKGDLDTAGHTTSQTQDAHCERLALKILVADPSGRWENVDPKDLVSTVRSRISTLKSDYQKHKKSLGETGFGLVAEDREEELYGDPQNIWEKIQEDFPWFKRMHALLDGSPVHDTDACTNSNDSLDSKLFGRALDTEMAQDDGSSIIVISDDADVSSTADFDADSTLTDDDSGATPASDAPPTVKAGKATVKTEKTGDAAKPAAIAKPVPKPTVGAAPKRKRETMLDTLKDIVGQDHKSKVELLEMSHKAKRQRTEMELKYKAVEAEKARAHELQTLKLQIQLAQINSGVRMTSVHTVNSSERSTPFGASSVSPYGAASKSSRCNTPYSMSDADFGSGEPSSSSHDNLGLPFSISDSNDSIFPLPSSYHSTYNTQNDSPYHLPASSES